MNAYTIGVTQNHASSASSRKCCVSRRYTLIARQQDAERARERAAARSARAAATGCTPTRRASRTIASTTNSTRLCRKKCTSMLPTAASGRISRGNDTFFTSPAFATTDRSPRREPGREEVPHEQAREQADRERGNARAEDLRERDVEDHEVEQRVEQRPREPEDAVLVLDLELFADHPDEELAVLRRCAGSARATDHAGPDDRRAHARGARDGLWHSGQVSGHCPGSRCQAPGVQPQPGPDRAVIGRRLGQHLAADAPSTPPRTSTWSIWLCGVSRGIRAARAPARRHRGSIAPTAGSPEVEVAGEDLRSARAAGAAAAASARWRTGASRPQLRRRVQPDRPRPRCRATSIVHAQRDARAGGIVADHVPIGSTRRSSTGNREQIASSHVPSPGIVVARAPRGC